MNAPKMMPPQDGPQPAALSMTIRDEFALHAPESVPYWFNVPTDPMPEALPSELALMQQPLYNGMTGNDKDTLLQWMAGDGDWDLPEELQATGAAAMEARKASREQREQFGRMAEAHRYFFWRWHYADMMLQSRQHTAAMRAQQLVTEEQAANAQAAH